MLNKEDLSVINSGVYLLNLKIHESWISMMGNINEEDYEKINKNFTSYISSLNEFSAKINFNEERTNRDKFTVADILILNDIENTLKKNNDLQLSLLASIIKDTAVLDKMHTNIVNTSLHIQTIREYIKSNLAE